MMRAVLICALLFFSSASDARPRGVVAYPAQGSVIYNIPDQNFGVIFANFLKGSTPNINSPNTTAMFDDNGYPNGTALGTSYFISPYLPALTTSEVLVLDWTGAIPASALQLFGATNLVSCVSSAGSGCASNCVSSGGSGSGNTVFGKAGSAGTNCRVEFTLASAFPGNASIVMFFVTGTAPNISSIRLFRKADEVDGNLPFWNPDLLTTMRQLRGRGFRGVSNMLPFGNENTLVNGQWSLRMPTESISYAMRRYPTSQISVGEMSISGINWTASGSYPDQPSDWVDKETWQAKFTSATSVSYSVTNAANDGTGKIQLTVADTSALSDGQVICYTGYNGTGSGPGYGLWRITVKSPTQVVLDTTYPGGNPSAFSVAFGGTGGFFTTMTVQLGSRAPKPLIGISGNPAGAFNTNTIQAVNNTMMYDAQLDAVIFSGGGLFTGMSPDMFYDLAEQVDQDPWIIFPAQSSNSYIQSAAQLASSVLSAGRTVYVELSNEPWNFAFLQSALFAAKSEAIGAITTTTSAGGNLNSIYSYMGLRSAQLFDLFSASYSRPANVWGVLNSQFAPGVAIGNMKTREYEGLLLDPTSNQTLCAYLNGAWNGSACSGATNYSAYPNRPIDKTRGIATAPYTGISYATTGVAAIAQQYQTDPTGALTAFTNLALAAIPTANTSIFGEYETTMASYDGSRPPGYAALAMTCYEGGPGFRSATMADYVAQSLTASGSATFNIGSSPAVNQTAHGYLNGGKVRYTSGTVPTGISLNTDYFVINATADNYDLSSVYYGPTAITLSGSGGPATAQGSTTSYDNLIEGWKNSAGAQTWTRAYFDLFRSYPHNKYMAYLQINGDRINLQIQQNTDFQFNQWAILPGGISSVSLYPPTQLYWGAAQQ